MKLMILDGNSVINRAFYGVRPLTTRDGLYTNAIYGFLNILEKERARKNRTRCAWPLTCTRRRSAICAMTATRLRATPCRRSLPCRCRS